MKMGSIAKDKITGFEGVVIGITRNLTNQDRYTIAPRKVNADGRPAKSRSYDATSLVYVGESGLSIIEPIRVEDAPDLGDEVLHELSGLTGVVFQSTTWIEGCTSVAIQPAALDKDGQPVDGSVFDERCVKVTKIANPKPAPVKTGGPRPEPRRAHD